jgi:hypothetical protein
VPESAKSGPYEFKRIVMKFQCRGTPPAARRLCWAFLLTACVQSQAAPSRSLCAPNERTVFACESKTKIASVCATGNFSAATGSLTYRFGAFGKKPEFVYESSPATVASRFAYEEETWAKGTAISLKFQVGTFTYVVHHARGAFGVDGGPNRAGVSVERDSKQVADIRCHEASTVNHMYDELSGTDLHRNS